MVLVYYTIVNSFVGLPTTTKFDGLIYLRREVYYFLLLKYNSFNCSNSNNLDSRIVIRVY